MVITTITGFVTGREANPTTLPESVYINNPVAYYLSDSGFRTTSVGPTFRTMHWNEKTNIIIDADPEIELIIFAGDIYGEYSWSGGWVIYGYCFTP